MTRKIPKLFGILALAAGMLLILLEINSLRRGGEIAWFWIAIALFAIVLGLVDLMSRSDASR